MPRYAVDVKVLINVEVAAPNSEEAIRRAEAWVDWLSPTDEQLADYVRDHEDASIYLSGGFALDGLSDVEEIADE